jgi:ABC-type bacteriocin/lantibiotic exporter with double-glycine peptidase domain
MLKIFEGIPKKRILIDMLLACIWSAFNCYFAMLLSQLAESVLDGNGDLLRLIVFFFAYLFIWELFELWSDVYSTMTMTAIENNVQAIYFNKIYHIKPSVLKKNNTGYISGLLTKLIHLQTAAYSQIVLFVPLAIVYLGYFIWQLGTYHYAFGLALFLLIVVATLFRLIGNKIVKPKIHDLSVAEANRNKLIVDTVTNVGTVQKMQASDFINRKMDNEVDNCWKKTKTFSVINEIFFCGFKLLTYSYVPICLAIYYFILKQNLDNANGFFALLSVVSIQIVHISKNLATGFSRYARFKGAREKLDEIVNDDNIRQQIETEHFENAEIVDVDYVYKNENIGNTIHIQIPHFRVDKGDIICIHGESGQGKTTLLHLLSGEIESDGIYINEHKTDRRIECVFIAQDTEILDMSIRDNLSLGNKEITDEKLIDYIDMVGLKPWFDAQEDKLDTILGERGVFVSTGQRQRLNLIRGLLIQDKEIYLLDEPTSNVDDKTEDTMISLIRSSLKNKTAIIVTHKPKIKEICNHSYVFKNGILEKEF